MSRFLVSTTHHLLLLDSQNQVVHHVDSGHGLYYGICRHKGVVYVACRNEIHGPDRDDARKNERGSVLVFDPDFKLRAQLQPEFPMRDVHGMTVIDDHLWVTCSYDNLIAIYDLRSRTWRQWYPSADPVARGTDVNHFNTVAMVEGRICVLAHNFGRSQLLFYDYPSLHLHSSVWLGVQAHDLFHLDGRLATCSSAEGALVSLDGSWIRTGNFPRGVAVAGDEILVGISMLASRSQRGAMSGIVRRYTPRWEFQTDFVFDDCGMILAIEPLAGCDPVRLTLWPHVRKFSGGYNDLAPGNIYNSGDGGFFLSEWHAAEADGRWTAAKNARMTIVRNPGENHLTIAASSWYPGPFPVEIALDDVLLGVCNFEGPGTLKSSLACPVSPGRPETVTFRISGLWRPSDTLSGSLDERFLGLFVSSIALER